MAKPDRVARSLFYKICANMASSAMPIAKRLRALVDEKRAAKAAGAARASSSSKEEVDSPSQLEDFEFKLGGLCMDHLDCVAVAHVEDIDEKLAHWGWVEDDSCIAALEEVVGSYWKLGVNNGPPIWRQAGPDGLFLFFYPPQKGWIICSSATTVTDETQRAWCPRPSDHGTFPDKVHVPFWAKKPCELVRTLDKWDDRW